MAAEDWEGEFMHTRRIILRSAGHDVTGAEAAEQALQAVKKNKPQIILLDLLLPGIDSVPDFCPVGRVSMLLPGTG